jgi:hypothetical protein
MTDVAVMVSEKWRRPSSGDSRSAVSAIRRGRMVWLKLYRPGDKLFFVGGGGGENAAPTLDVTKLVPWDL